MKFEFTTVGSIFIPEGYVNTFMTAFDEGNERKVAVNMQTGYVHCPHPLWEVKVMAKSPEDWLRED